MHGDLGKTRSQHKFSSHYVNDGLYLYYICSERQATVRDSKKTVSFKEEVNGHGEKYEHSFASNEGYRVYHLRRNFPSARYLESSFQTKTFFVNNEKFRNLGMLHGNTSGPENKFPCLG